MPGDLAYTLSIVAKTLRQTAWWSEQSQDYLDAAEAVEAADAESLAWVCPVCEETTCDEGCPLAEVRAR